MLAEFAVFAVFWTLFVLTLSGFSYVVWVELFK